MDHLKSCWRTWLSGFVCVTIHPNFSVQLKTVVHYVNWNFSFDFGVKQPGHFTTVFMRFTHTHMLSLPWYEWNMSQSVTDMNVLDCEKFYRKWERTYKSKDVFCVSSALGQSESVLLEETLYAPAHTHTHTHTHTQSVFSRPYNPVTAPYSTLGSKSKAAVSLQQRFVWLITHKHVHKAHKYT